MNVISQFSLLSLAIALATSAPDIARASEDDELMTFIGESRTATAPAMRQTMQPAQPVAIPQTQVVSHPVRAVAAAQPLTMIQPVQPVAVAQPVTVIQPVRPVAVTQAPTVSQSVQPIVVAQPSVVRQPLVAPAATGSSSGKLLSFSRTENVSAKTPVAETTNRATSSAAIPAEERLDFVAESSTIDPRKSFDAGVNSRQSMSAPLLTPYQPSAALPKMTARTGVAPAEHQIKAIFHQAVVRAITDSPRINSARAQSSAAVQSVDEAKGQRWPQIDLTTSSKSAYFGGGSRPQQGGSDLPSIGVNMSTSLYDFGKVSNTIKSREDQARAASIGVQVEAEDTAWQVSSSLLELSKQRLIIQLSRDYVIRMQELTSMLDGIVKADPGRRSELTQAKGKFLQAQSSLDTAVSKARDTEIVLFRLIGETQVPLPTAAEWQMSFANLDQELQATESHPTIAKAKAETQAALSEAAAVRSSGLPSVNWVVSKNTGKDINGQTQAFQTGVQLSWGLFRGGSTRASEQAALLRAESARQQTFEQKNDLQQRIRAADQDAHSLQTRANLYKNLTVESDRIRLAFFDQWYHLGKRTLLDVLGAETDYYNNRVSEVTSRFDSYSAIFRGYASSGQLVQWLGNKPKS